LYSSSQLIIYNNTINEKPLFYINGKDNMIIPSNAGEIIIANCSNCTINEIKIKNTNPAIEILSSKDIQIHNCDLANNGMGLWIYDSHNLRIFHNTFINNSWSGLWLYRSDQIEILNNVFKENDDGILLFRSKNNHIKNNTFSENTGGLSCWSSFDRNMISLNNFIKDQVNAYDNGYNQWKANYWDNWVGLNHPLFRWSPYYIFGGINIDTHPATKPYDISRI
jgi:parallel beta-helix repeat protein